MNLLLKEEIEYCHYYDLNEWGFDLTQQETSKNNKVILGKIADDFADRFTLAPTIVKEAFKIEYLTIRTTEDILILYNLKGLDDVDRVYLNVNTEYFKYLFG